MFNAEQIHLFVSALLNGGMLQGVRYGDTITYCLWSILYIEVLEVLYILKKISWWECLEQEHNLKMKAIF
jgi:hypothetical protein